MTDELRRRGRRVNRVATLKAEIGARVWATRAEARQAVFAYLSYYNHDRLHSTLQRSTPYDEVGIRRPDPGKTALSAPSMTKHAVIPLPESLICLR